MLTDEECNKFLNQVWKDWLPVGEKTKPQHMTAWERAIVRAAFAAGMERAAQICEQQIVARFDDHVANYFDGGCRHCAEAIREAAKCS